ncbi:ferredoxin reductase-like C-terminal NADP-linked domain-containing protein [Cytidiella melzeri]|nr:ferredoxin reductase-like C-terminal NADP-linked domain-containing protein [Cytidiella melzeri]
MSFIRASLSARTFVAHTRRYATAPPPPAKSSNLPLYLSGAGVAGLAAYIYIDRYGPEVTPKKVQEKSPLDPDNFVDFKLKKIEPYNHNTAKYIFELPNGEASLLPVASCVVVKSASDSPEPLLGKNEKPIIRPYTPVSPSDAEGELTFLIKRYEGGKMSQYIHNLKPGEKLAIKGPIPKIAIEANKWEEVGLIAGGSGITPMYQILHHALNDPSNKTRFTLIFANVTPADILLKEEFDSLKAKYPEKFEVVYVLDKPEGDWKGAVGYVNKRLIEQHIPPASLGEKVKVMVCGPPGQVNAIAGKKDGMKQGQVGGVLKELGYTEDQVFKF